MNYPSIMHQADEPGKGVKGGKPVCDYSCVEADGGASTLLSFQTFLGQGDDVNTVSVCLLLWSSGWC